MNIKPMGSRVLLKVSEPETKTSTGIYLPPSAQEKTQEGEVMAIGDIKENKLSVSDKVIYDKYAGTTVNIDSKEYLLIKIEDILAIIS